MVVEENHILEIAESRILVVEGNHIPAHNNLNQMGDSTHSFEETEKQTRLFRKMDRW